MKNTSHPLFILLCMAAFSTAVVADQLPLRESTIVEIVNSVQVLSGEAMDGTAAEPGQIFRYPDFMQTGRRSRAQLEAADGTITRVGSNTLFSFGQEDRTLQLQRGSLLFHAPEGRGGGSIVTGSATASVTGTTVLVIVSANGDTRILVLEGSAETSFADGTILLIGAGQMIAIQSGQAGADAAGSVQSFNLGLLAGDAVLINGFEQQLPSLPQIMQAIEQQLQSGEEGAEVDVETMEQLAEALIVLGAVVSASVDAKEVVFTNLADGNRTILVGPDGVIVIRAREEFDPNMQRVSNADLRSLSEAQRRLMVSRLQGALQQMMANMRQPDSELSEEDVVAVIKFLLSIDLPWDESFIADNPQVQAILGTTGREDQFSQADDSTPPVFEETEPTPEPTPAPTPVPPVVTPPITPGPYFAP